MGKKRIIKKTGAQESGPKTKNVSVSKKNVEYGVLQVQSTFNNTLVNLTDNKGNTLAWSSSGAVGFKGAKRGTPFAAAKVGEFLGEKAQAMGIKEVGVIIRGVGAGRESAVRGFISKGISLSFVRDETPLPHNGPRPPRPRRV